MTISSTGARVAYMGNGTTVTFPYGYPFFYPTDLLVLLFNTATNQYVSPAPVLNGAGTYDYVVNGTQDPSTGEYLGGGSVVTNNAPPGGYKLMVLNAIPFTQSLALSPNAKIPVLSLNSELDRLTLLCQQLLLSTSYAVLAPFSDTAPSFILPPAALRASQILGFDQLGNVITVPLTGASAQGVGGVPTFSALAAAQGVDLSLLNLVFVQGYAAPGDGGEAYWKKVAAQPYHSVYFQDAAGNYWVPAQSKFDPRAFGAQANVVVCAQGEILSGNLSQLIINDAGFAGFTAADVGKSITAWDYPCAHALCNTTIAGVVSSTIVNLTAPASAASAFNLNVAYGSDDSATLNACMTLAAFGATGFQASPPPNAAHNTSAFNQFGQGGHTIILRALDRATSRYGIASTIVPTNNVVIEMEENACLWALGTFPSSNAMFSDAGTNPLQLTLLAPKFECNGFAALGMWIRNANYFTVKNGISVRNGLNGGVQLGATSGTSCSTWSINGKVHIEGISTTMPGYVNNATAIGFWADNAADGNIPGYLEVINYRTAWRSDSGDVHVGIAHFWTNSNGGYFTNGAVINGIDNSFRQLEVDTLWAPAGTICCGVEINAIAFRIGSYTLVENTATATVQDDSIDAVQYNNSEYAPPSVDRVGSRIDQIYTQTKNAAVKLRSVVNAGSASNLVFDVGSIQSDGNYYDIGWATQTERVLSGLNANVASLQNVMTAALQAINGSAKALWTPQELSGALAFWLDPNLVGTNDQGSAIGGVLDLDSNSCVRGWYSRYGNGRALQSLASQRPAYSTTSWTGTAGGVAVPVKGGVTFAGSATPQFLLLDDMINNQTDVRLFACVIPASSASGGPILRFNNPPNFGGLLHQAAAGTAIVFDNPDNAGNGVTTVAGTPALITGIWSSTSAEATGSFGRLNGGTNTAAQALLQQNEPVDMGADITSNVVSAATAFTLGQLVVVIGPMTLAQEQVVEGYLAWTFFGATGGHSAILPSGHPYYSAAPNA